MNDLIHRTSTDGKTTICGAPALPGQSVGVFSPNKVTCPMCARNATTTYDPANWMLKDGVTTTPTVYRGNCYICRDPEYAQMGLPLCYPCPLCTREHGRAWGHVPADDTVCTDCHRDTYPEEYGPAPDGVPSITNVPTGDFL